MTLQQRKVLKKALIPVIAVFFIYGTIHRFISRTVLRSERTLHHNHWVRMWWFNWEWLDRADYNTPEIQEFLKRRS